MKDLFYHTDPLQQLREQGVDLSQSASEAAAALGAEEGESGAPVPGSTTPPETTDSTESSAGTENADTSQSTGPPESVPYARFKEVNDQLRGYKDIERLGYDADSVRRLAQWGAQFDQNPVDSFLDLGARIEGLPANVAAAIEEHLERSGTGSGQGTSRSDEASDNDDGPPDWFKPFAEKLDKTSEFVEVSEREAIAAENNKILNELMDRWKDADKEDAIRSPKDRVMLQYISAVASTAKDLDDVFAKARGEWMEDREDLLDGTVERPTTTTPSSVSGSGAHVREAPPKPQSLEEVNARVEADLLAGKLDMSGIGKRS